MYEKISKKQHRVRPDWKFGLLIGGTLAFLVLTILLAAYPMSVTGRFNRYKKDLQESIRYSQEHQSMTVLKDGRSAKIPAEYVSAMHKKIVFTIGMGKPMKEEDLVPGEEYVSLSFGDGSELTAYPTVIEDEYHEISPGIIFAYTGADGEKYIYDTNRMSYEVLIRDLHLEMK